MILQVMGEGIQPPANEGDCGFDLFSPVSVSIPARSSILVDTETKVAIPQGYYGKVFSRSGLSVKHRIEVGAGVIDSNYRGDIIVHLYNHSDVEVTIPAEIAIAQLVIMPYLVPAMFPVTEFKQTSRNDRGFGSTDTLPGEATTWNKQCPE